MHYRTRLILSHLRSALIGAVVASLVWWLR
jgi:hypothetical protein